jgi:hypothetical protein
MGKPSGSVDEQPAILAERRPSRRGSKSGVSRNSWKALAAHPTESGGRAGTRACHQGFKPAADRRSGAHPRACTESSRKASPRTCARPSAAMTRARGSTAGSAPHDRALTRERGSTGGGGDPPAAAPGAHVWSSAGRGDSTLNLRNKCPRQVFYQMRPLRASAARLKNGIERGNAENESTPASPAVCRRSHPIAIPAKRRAASDRGACARAESARS